ncbi:MAG TPA: hypothetical protein ENJ08_11965 [Gammaproteobacteria bacterium]|nr:hypothetical protein [Gammaproteobacteria bacterium]
MNTIMKSILKAISNRCFIWAGLTLPLLALTSSATASLLSIADAPLFVTNAQKANVLVILDNSNSMDESETGEAVGSDSPVSKSEVARNAVKGLITNYTNKINMGLMAYQQKNVVSQSIHNSPYDASFDKNNYDPSYTGPRDSLTKRFRTPNFSNPGTFVYYNIALPFYAGGNYGHAYCYSGTANFDNGSETYPGGPWDDYSCYKKKIDEVDSTSGFPLSSYWFGGPFVPTDSDLAQNILDFGTFLTWDYVGPTWFANSSPGRGYLHVPVSDLDASQAVSLNTKLATSQFTVNAPTDPSQPLQNAGLTPMEGTLLTAKDYFEGTLSKASEGGPATAPPESCGKNFIALMTDGLPSTSANGSVITDPITAIKDAANAAAALKATSIGVTNGNVETYVIGFSLPVGTDPTALDQVAAAGGTNTAFQANDPASLQTAFDAIFNDILAKTGASSSAATNSTSLSTTSRIFQARFNSGDWSGQLISRTINVDGTLGAIQWDAGDGVALPLTSAARQIITYSRDSNDGIAFKWSLLDALTDKTQRDFLNIDAFGVADGLGSDRVGFLRGDDVAGFRNRGTKKLGDIINSSPFFLGAPDAGYAESEMVGYTAFHSANDSRVPMIYAGSNDGMLHGFSANDGTEKIAYIPSQVYENLSALTDPGYGAGVAHRYLVDGSPMLGDANLGTDALPNWKTVLAAGLNAGGQGYYALDVTDPTLFTETNAANTVLWEFTDEDDSDLGYSFNQPVLNRLTNQSAQIARMANGEWALIVGNGYNNSEVDGHASTTGHAYLYILFLNGGLDGDWSDPGDYIKIDTGVGSIATPNGLATPRPIDVDGDGRVDVIYAGDLTGRMWKFDVSSVSTAGWGVANSGAPLYRAKDSSGTSQPITTAPLVTLVPGGDYIIGFATGLYIGVGDIATTGTQTMYGIIDDGTTGTVAGRPALVQQTIDSVAIDGATGFEIRLSSQNPIDFATKKGWYMDLPESGERVVFNPILRDGRFVFTTLTPDSAVCASGGSSWLMELNYLTGGRLNVRPFTQVEKQGAKQVSGIRIGNILPTPTILNDRKNSKEYKIGNDSSGTANVISESVQNRTGRLLWREIR